MWCKSCFYCRNKHIGHALLFNLHICLNTCGWMSTWIRFPCLLFTFGISLPLSPVMVFQGIERSRLAFNRMTAHHLYIHVEVTSAPGVSRPVPSAFMSQQNMARSTQSLPEILSVNTRTRRWTLPHVMQNYTEHIIFGSQRVLDA